MAVEEEQDLVEGVGVERIPEGWHTLGVVRAHGCKSDATVAVEGAQRLD